MGRSKATTVENNFINGLITDATGLNFPENACTDADNVVFDSTARVFRRKGFAFEAGYANKTVTNNNYALTEYFWNAAGGSGTFNFAVHQVGNLLYFYRVLDYGAWSANQHATTIDLNTFKTAGAPAVEGVIASFASGKGYLFVTHQYCEPFYIAYDTVGNTLTATAITISCRDFEGLDDGLKPDERPAVLSNNHKYNLFNQGWSSTKQDDSATDQQVVTEYFSKNAVYPSNAEQWWQYKNASEQLAAQLAQNFDYGNSIAPKGRYILPWFATNRSSQSGIVGLPERTSFSLRPSCCAFFAGRVFYSGVGFGKYSGEIYFTQIVENDTQFGKCYQQNDPTSETLSDLLPSDGGIIKILDIGYVYKMFATQKALLLFASNGIWSISGSETNSFKADDYTIKKISSVVVTSVLSIVDVQGAPIFFGGGDIWAVQLNADQFEVVSLSRNKIARLLSSIPVESRRYIKAAYDPQEKIVQFLYRPFLPTTLQEAFTYTNVLSLNVVTGAFYKWSISSATKSIVGILPIIDVAQTDTGEKNVEFRFKYFTLKNSSGTTYNIYFAQANSTGYVDWPTDSENISYFAQFYSGYRLRGDGNKKFQTNYITFFLEEQTNAGAIFQGIWDYSNDFTSKEWSTAQHIYAENPSHTYRMRKLKLRGQGRALLFRIISVTNKPFTLVGWSALDSGNQDV